MLLAGTARNYQGKAVQAELPRFKLRFEPVRKHIPVWIVSLNQKGVEFTARHTQRWLPSMIPLNGLAQPIRAVRAIVKEAGRRPNDVGQISGSRDDHQ